MNLRTHTYSIPAVSGLAVLALLVTADYGFRRLTQGPGYGFAAYIIDVNHRGTVVGDAVPVAALQAEAAPAPSAPPLLFRLAMAVPSVAALPLRAGRSAPPLADLVPAEEVALAEVPPAADEVAAEEPPVARVTCTTEQGFKRCRVGQ